MGGRMSGRKSCWYEESKVNGEWDKMQGAQCLSVKIW